MLREREVINIPKICPDLVRRISRRFADQRFFQLQVGLTGDKPISLLRARQGKKFFRLIISPFILSNRVPNWVEDSISIYARTLLEKIFGRSINERDLTAELDQLYENERNYHLRIIELTQPSIEANQLGFADVEKPKTPRELWLKLRREYFPERSDLDRYKIVWSMRRQTRSLATCNVYTEKVAVAHAMNQPEYLPFLEALIYHEMCHAVLGKPLVKNGRRVLHGREFKALERRHPGIKLLDSWIHAGGWAQAVRREAARKGAQTRKIRKEMLQSRVKSRT